MRPAAARPRLGSRKRWKLLTTAAASSLVPSWKVTPGRSLKVQVLPASVPVQEVASEGTIFMSRSRVTRPSYIGSRMVAVTEAVWSPGSIERGASACSTVRVVSAWAAVASGASKRAPARRRVNDRISGLLALTLSTL